MSPTDLPPLRDDVLYDAELAGQYVGRNALWMKRAALAGQIPAIRAGRFWRWNAAHIRSIVAGEPHAPRRKRRPSSRRTG